MVPCSYNFSRAALSSPAKANGTRRGGSLTGAASPVSITCSSKLVWPKSLSCFKNTFSNSLRRWPIACLSSYVQSLVHVWYSSVRWDGTAIPLSLPWISLSLTGESLSNSSVWIPFEGPFSFSPMLTSFPVSRELTKRKCHDRARWGYV